MCCGEPIGAQGDPHSRNPNLCASCSSMADGMPESSISGFPDFDDKMLVETDFHPVTAEPVTHGDPQLVPDDQTVAAEVHAHAG